MKKFLKIAGIVLLVLVAALIGFYIKVSYSIESRSSTVYAFAPANIEVSPDSVLLAEGEMLSIAKGCRGCHGEDLAGKVMVDNFPLGYLVAANLTKGKGGLPADYTTSDWVLALQHGIRKDGKPLLFMPSHEFCQMTEHDMAAVIAYCSNVPPVDREFASNDLGPLAKILGDQEMLELFPVEKIDHERPLTKDIRREVSLEYGKYISLSCQGCHKVTMKGGEPVAPGFPMVADISNTGNPGKWTEEQFISTLRTGQTPEGKTLDPEAMPWPMSKGFTDTDLKALHLYLKSL